MRQSIASYKKHTQFNLLFALPLFLGLAFYLNLFTWNQALFFSGAFIYGTLFMSPDVDVANQIKLFSFRGLMTLPFRPYSFFFKHRGLSHKPILGTLTRLIWLLIILAFCFWIFDRSSFISIDELKNYKTPILYASLGFILSDLCHLILDF
ncbi:MAG: DUF2227 family putative metal-binding protein [Simkaniaceae bacterium]